MSAFSIEYDFEEMQLCGDGIMAWGTATLIHDCDGEFYVEEILLDGKRLDRHGSGHFGFPSVVNKAIFHSIAIQIEESTHAQETFSEALRESRDGNPDRAYDERRDHQAMGWI